MTKKESKFDIAVIGAGPGGYPAAIKAAQEGYKVAPPVLISPKTGNTLKIENKKNYQIEEKDKPVSYSGLIKGIE